MAAIPIGEGAIRIFPNADEFHTKLRAILAKARKDVSEIAVPLKLEENDFTVDLDLIKQEIADLDGEIIEVDVLLMGQQEFKRDLQRFREELSDESIEIKVELEKSALEHVNEQLDNLKEENDRLDFEVFVHKKQAELELRQLKQEYDNVDLKWTVKTDVDHIPRPEEVMPTKQETQRPIVMPKQSPIQVPDIPLPKPDIKKFETEWNSLNFVPKLLSTMSSQWEAGIRQIYDPYVNMIVKVGRKMKEPFEKFGKFMEKTETLEEFWQGIKRGVASAGKDVDKLKAKFQKFTDVAKAAFHTLRRTTFPQLNTIYHGFNKLSLAAKQFGANLVHVSKREAKFMLDAFVSLGSAIATSFHTAVFKARLALNKLSGVGKSVLGFVKGAFANLGPIIGDVLEAAFFDAFKGLSRLSNWFATLAVNPLIQGLPRALAPLASKIAAGFAILSLEAFRHLPAVGRMFSTLGHHVTNFVRSARAKLARFFAFFGRIGSFILRPFRAVFGKIRGLFSSLIATAKRFTAPLIGAFGRWAAKSKAVFSILKRGFARLGQYVAGFARMAVGMFAKIGGILFQAIMPALMAVGAGLGAMAGQAAIGMVMSLANALISVAGGAALIAPGLLMAAGISFAALKIGLDGVKEGVKAAFSAESPEEFEKAIEKLSPSVQGVARSLREFKPMWDDIKKATQENLLQDLGPEMGKTLQNLLPTFGEGLKGIATAWNGAFKGAFAELQTDQARTGLQTIMNGATEMANNMQPVLANVIAALGSLGEQSAKYLGGIGTYFADLSQRFRDWAEGLKQIDPSTGMSKFDSIIQSAQKNASLLKDIFGGIFGVIGNILKASSEGGGGMLAGLAEGAQKLKDLTAEGTPGFQALVGFFQQASNAARELATLIEPILTIATSIGSALAQVAAAAIPGIKVALDALASGLQPLMDIAPRIGQMLGDAFAALGPALQGLGAALAPLIEGIVSGLSIAVQGLGQALTPIMEALGPAMEALKPVLESVGQGLSAIFIALEPIITSSINLISQLMPVVQTVMDLLGQIAAKALEVIAPLFTGHDSVIAQLVQALEPLAQVLGDAILKVLDALAPVIPMISDGFGRLLAACIPLVDPVKEIIDLLGRMLVDAINWLKPLIPPLIDTIVAIAKAIVDFVTPVIKAFVGFIQAVWPVISSVIEFAVKTIIAPALELIAGACKILGGIFGWLVNNVIIPLVDIWKAVMKGVGEFISWVIDNLITKPVEGLEGIFRKAVDMIKSVWNTLKKIFSDPVEFLVNTVYNDGIVALWNKVAGFLGMDDKKLEKFNYASKYASGGVLPGYTPGTDIHKYYNPYLGWLYLSGGEAIMRPEWTQAVGGPAAVEAMNKTAREGGVGAVRRMLGEGAAYKKGGTIDLDKRIAELFRELKPEHGKPYQYGGTGNPSWDCSGIWSGITQFLNGGDLRGGRIFNTESNFESFGYVPGLSGRVTIGVLSGKGGGENGHMAGTIDGVNIESGGSNGVQIGGLAIGSDNGMFNHTYTLKEFLGEFVSGGHGGGGFVNIVLQQVMHAITAILDPLEHLIKEKLGGNGWKDLQAGLAIKMLTGVKDFALDNAKKFGGAAGTAGNPESWREMAKAAMRRVGFNADDPRQVQAMLEQIMDESSGDAGTAQRIVDVNGTGDAAGVGLLQIIPSTFEAYRDPDLPNDRRDPMANMVAALRYYKARYGDDLTTRWGRGKGGYDKGGHAVGVGYMPKYTLEPERVLSPAQTRAFDVLVYRMLPAYIDEAKKKPFDFDSNFKLLVKELKGLRSDLDRDRDKWIDAQADRILVDYRNHAEKKVKLDPVDLEKLKNQDQKEIDKAQRHLKKADEAVHTATYDPQAYLKAEEEAKKRLDKEQDEKKQKEREARKEQRKKEREARAEERKKIREGIQEQRKKEREARTEQRKEERKERAAERRQESKERRNQRREERKELQGDRKKLTDDEKKALEEKTDAENDAIREQHEAENDAISAQHKAENEAISAEHKAENDALKAKWKAEDEQIKKQEEAEDKQREKEEKEEDERINKLKETGEYYYGYKVLSADGNNPYAHEETREEKIGKSTVQKVGESVGLSGLANALVEMYNIVVDTNNDVQAAMPAWKAAAAGDPSGLAHNSAVIAEKNNKQLESDLEGFIPGAIASSLEFAFSGSWKAGREAPLVGTINTGISKAELRQELDYLHSKQRRSVARVR